jgi:hypothetical protein
MRVLARLEVPTAFRAGGALRQSDRLEREHVRQRVGHDPLL